MRYLTTDGEWVEFTWRTPFNYNTDQASLETGLACTDKSLTQQSQAKEADINTIVRNFGVTGQLPVVPLPPSLEDFGEIFDLQSALDVLNQAKHSFGLLPADVRDAFHNDPHRFVSQVDSMLADTDVQRREQNLAVMRAWGIALPPGPKVDQTQLGDILAAIKAQGTQGASPAPGTPGAAPGGAAT